MSTRRAAVATAVLVVLGSATGVPGAHAADAATLYVGANWPSATCSDSAAGAGSKTTPFCTIQAAVDIAQPGDTVLVGSGSFAPFTVSTSGTAEAPITITSVAHSLGTTSSSGVAGTGTTPTITISGANYVDLSGFRVVTAAASDLLITNSGHVVVDGNAFAQSTQATDTQPLIHLTGGSSAVTLSRNSAIAFDSAALLAVDGGGAGDVITTNYLGTNLAGPGVLIGGMSDIDVTSNTVDTFCGTGIQVAGATTAKIQNNVVYGRGAIRHCTVPPASIVGLSADASSAAGSTADYNVIDASFAGAGAVDYSWAGTTYSSAASFASATGQGTHDVSSYTVANAATVSGVSQALIDSANADAPGELATDVRGNARVDDPVVSDTGTGTHSYYDRGAIEQQQTTNGAYLSLADPDGSLGPTPVGGTVTLSGQVFDGWNGATKCTFDFGDGTGATAPVQNQTVAPECITTHQYAATGTYTPKLTVVFSDGTSETTGVSQITITPAAPLVPSFSLVADSSTGVLPHCGATSGWTIDSITVDFGDEGTAVSSCTDHHYERAGTYTVTMTAKDSGGNTASVTKTFTTAGDFYTPIVPVRVLDTRASFKSVPANGTIRFKPSGLGLPSTGLDAIALNVTVTNAGAGGYVTAYPDGTAKPAVSNLNFSAGQTIANTVIVKVGADGYIDLTNTSSAPVDLIADAEGSYSTDGYAGYHPVTPTRVLDTRASKATVAANATTKVYFGSYTGAAAVTLNITAVNERQGGYITAYPDGWSMPTASNVNFGPGQVIQNEAIVEVGSDGYVDFTNTSGGTVDLVIDLTGYFTGGSGMGFVPINPTRILDTRKTLVSGVQPNGIATGTVGGGAAPFDLGVPAAIAANVTVTNPAAGGYVTVYPAATPRPITSVLNFSPGQTIANAATVGTSNGQVSLYNGSSGRVDLITDVFGFYN